MHNTPPCSSDTGTAIKIVRSGHAFQPRPRAAYRSVANAYWSRRVISKTEEIRLRPSADVNDMLIADKVQNRKDFLVDHGESHPRFAELPQYSFNWLLRLGAPNCDC